MTRSSLCCNFNHSELMLGCWCWRDTEDIFSTIYRCARTTCAAVDSVDTTYLPHGYQVRTTAAEYIHDTTAVETYQVLFLSYTSTQPAVGYWYNVSHENRPTEQIYTPRRVLPTYGSTGTSYAVCTRYPFVTHTWYIDSVMPKL